MHWEQSYQMYCEWMMMSNTLLKSLSTPTPPSPPHGIMSRGDSDIFSGCSTVSRALNTREEHFSFGQHSGHLSKHTLILIVSVTCSINYATCMSKTPSYHATTLLKTPIPTPSVHHTNVINAPLDPPTHIIINTLLLCPTPRCYKL